MRDLLEGFLGIVLAALTLHDVFGTVVVPGSAKGPLRVSRRLVMVALPAWKRVGGGIGVHFAPVVLLFTFIVWMLLLVLAFALLVHAASAWFDPPLRNFSRALYLSGGAMATIGTGTTEPYGVAAAIVVAAGFSGLSVMTMAVTYLLEVQGNIGVRDAGVLKLTTVAGELPTALGLLERYAALGCPQEILRVIHTGRDWCAAVLQSHASHPSLIYFRSAGTGAGWPSTLGTLMDLALVLEWLVDEGEASALAVLLREQAHGLARELTLLIGLSPEPSPPAPGELDQLQARLAAAGYRLRETADVEGFVQARGECVGCIDALSRHLGMPPVPLVNS